MLTIEERRRTTLSANEVKPSRVSRDLGRAFTTTSGWRTCLYEAVRRGPDDLHQLLPLLNASAGADNPSMSTRLAAFYEEICSYEDDWDGHGGLAPRAAAVARAALFLATVQAAVPAPEVMASSTGGVILEWERPSCEVLLHFDADAVVTAVVELGSETYEGPAASLGPELRRAWSLLSAA